MSSETLNWTDNELQVLAQHTSEAIGIDLSEEMVKVYNAQAQSQVSTNHQSITWAWARRLQYPNSMQGSSRQAYQGNLADPKDPSPTAFANSKFFDFEVAGVGLGFHHFDKPDLASKKLAERLKPGGVLFIIDFVAHKIDPKDAALRGITHHGFTEDEIKKMFEDAGLTDFAYQELPEPITFKDCHSHDHGHGHGHSHGHNHEHNESNHGGSGEHGHGHGEKKGSTTTKRIFIARASKP
jgi:SAM-dependent methyltransferase